MITTKTSKKAAAMETDKRAMATRNVKMNSSKSKQQKKFD